MESDKEAEKISEEPPINKNELKRLERERLVKEAKKLALEREEAFDKASLNKIKDKWMNSLLEIRIPEMQDNLKHILHYMEKLIEADTFRKAYFEDERQELGERNLLQAQSHTAALNKLYNIYLRRVQDLRADYDQTVAERKEKTDQEVQIIREKENAAIENLECVYFQLSRKSKAKEIALGCDIFLKLDDETSKNTEKYESLKQRLEKRMEKRWGQITTTLEQYNHNTQQRRQEYLQLKAKDDADSKLIHQQMKKTQKLFEQLEQLKKGYDQGCVPKETLTMISDLREERDKFLNAFQQLKLIIAEEKKLDESILKDLTVLSNNLTEELTSMCIQGEKILTLFRICRKMEAEHEKVMPVGGRRYNARQGTDTPQTKKAQDEYGGVNFEENVTSDIQVLNRFWRKVGKVRLSTMALAKCISNLEKENEFLKKALMDYLRKIGRTYQKFYLH